MLLLIAYLINHTYSFYPGTVALWVTARVPPFPCTVIFFPELVVFSTRSESQNKSMVKHFSNNISLLIFNLISLVWFYLNKTSLMTLSKS